MRISLLSLMAFSRGIPYRDSKRKGTVPLDSLGQESRQELHSSRAEDAENIHRRNLFDARYTLIDPTTYFFANLVDSYGHQWDDKRDNYSSLRISIARKNTRWKVSCIIISRFIVFRAWETFYFPFKILSEYPKKELSLAFFLPNLLFYMIYVA